MDSSNGAQKFPPRLYREGSSPLQNRSMNHNCQLGNFSRVREAIGVDAWDEIKKSSLGLIPKLVDSDYVWSAKTVHYLLTRQLAIENENELWVLIGGQPIRFRLFKFAEITGLNTDAVPDQSCEADYRRFWTKLGVPPGVGPKYDELVKCFGRCRGWDLPERKMFGLLCILQMGIYGLHHNSRMPFETAKRVFNDEDIADYPWGRVAFRSLIDGVKIVQYGGNSYTVNGCVHALAFWAYESITVFGERFGRLLNPDEIPFLRWGGSRTREDLDRVISQEIEEYGEVRVRRMIMKPLEEIYPTWCDKSKNSDTQLHNLIVAIVEDKFDKGFWEDKGKIVKYKRKKSVEDEPPKKKKKREENFEKKPREGDEVTEEYGRNLQFNGLVKLVEKVYARMDDMEKNFSFIVKGIESSLVAKLDVMYGHRITLVEEKVLLMENEMNRLKERLESGVMENSIVKDGSSKIQDEEYTSPLRPHKKDKTPEKGHGEVGKKGDGEEKKKVNVDKSGIQEEVGKKGDGEEKKKVNVDKSGIQEEKRKGCKADSEVVDITDQYRHEENKLLSESETNEEDKLRNARLKLSVDLIQKTLLCFDGVGISKKKWSPVPPFPLIGDTGLTLMRKGVVASEAIYDPLKRPDEAKLGRVYELLAPYKHIPLSSKEREQLDEGISFYRILVTPRNEWPDRQYGWLYDFHMVSFFRLLRKRSMQVPTPFYTDRIAFIDQWFIQMWVRDYPQFNCNPKNWKFDQKYLDLANGLSPVDMPTRKKWVIDVDQLFICHRVNGNHWVTLHVDLVDEKIDCYDSNLGEATADEDKKLHEQCRVFTRMIPALLNEVLPNDVRKPSRKQFSWRRRKGIPQNENPGDCGVYALKYAEMLALGLVFEGLNDRTIQTIRLKMAAEIYDEVPDLYAQFNDA